MFSTPRFMLAIALLLLPLTAWCANSSNWIDAITIGYGKESNTNDADIFQLSLQHKWNRTWFNGGAWYVGGYWDAGLSYLNANANSGENGDLFDISLMPVLRWQRDASLSSGVSPFAEAGIGPHLLSETQLADQAYSTALQLGTLVGFGIGFGDRGQYELSYRYQYVSNLDFKKPNDGMNQHLLRLGYAFE
jgi:lipid A 3-O-deacylase